MPSRITKLFALIVTVSILLPANLLHACRCAKPADPKTAMEGCAAVFAGKVTKVELNDDDFTKTVTMEISTSWKGITSTKVSFTTTTSSAACGYPFEEDKEYLVYCHSDPKSGFSTNTCTRTNLLSEAKEDLDALGEGTPAK